MGGGVLGWSIALRARLLCQLLVARCDVVPEYLDEQRALAVAGSPKPFLYELVGLTARLGSRCGVISIAIELCCLPEQQLWSVEEEEVCKVAVVCLGQRGARCCNATWACQDLSGDGS